MRIAIDAMGGDFAPENILQGLKQALEEFEFDKALLVGQPEALEPLIKKYKINSPRVEIVPASQIVSMDDPAAICLRQKKDSSITVASKLLKTGDADALVSAGHTGAAVAATKVQNRMLPGIDRPGIASLFPSKTGFFIMLDVGANPDSKPIHLAQYAILGQTYSNLVLGIPSPSIGILSVGEEEHKGNELTKETMKIIRKMNLDNFLGNVEGKDLFSGNVDVVLCDGFVGNVVLKCSESLAKTMSSILKENLMKTPLRMAGAALSRRAFKELKEITDHDEYGGAPLLGINGNCIIAHGSSSPKAVKNAIRVACEMTRQNVNEHIQKKVSDINWQDILPES